MGDRAKQPSALSRTLSRTLNITVPTVIAGQVKPIRTTVEQPSAYCVLRTENIFVCWCCVGSDRAAGVGVSLGTLGLVRVDGRPCLGRCSHTTISRLRLSDRPLVLKDRLGPSTIRAAVRRRVLGFFSGAPPGTDGCHPRGSQSHKLHGHDPPYCHQEVAWGRVSPACSRRARRRTAPWLEPLSYAGPAQPVESVPCHYFPRVRLAIRATCAPVRPGRIRPGAFACPAAPWGKSTHNKKVRFIRVPQIGH